MTIFVLSLEVQVHILQLRTLSILAPYPLSKQLMTVGASVGVCMLECEWGIDIIVVECGSLFRLESALAPGCSYNEVNIILL